MLNTELITVIAVILFASVLAYRSSFFHNKKVGYISLMQIYFLVLLPGVLYAIIFSFMLDILQRPANSQSFVSDKLLSSLLLLSILFTYGGLAIHGISKTVSSYFKKDQRKSLAYKVNRHFHFDFSHNLSYSGAVASAAFFAMLEMNHVSPYPEGFKMLTMIINGVLIGIAMVLALILYEKRRWMELKFFFFALWLFFVIFLYVVRPYIKNVKSYPFTFTMLVAFSILALLIIFLSVRRIKNQFKISFRMPKRFFG